MSDIYDLKDDPQPFIAVEQVENQKPKGNRTLWIILIAIMVLLILCCCCIVGVLVFGIFNFSVDSNMLESMRNNFIY